MKITTANGVSIALIDKSLDAETAPNTQDVLLDLVQDGARKILCDFSQTDYISSRGLSAVLAAAKKLRNIGGEMAFCSVGQNVRQIFSISGFHEIFRIFESQDEALAELQRMSKSGN
ncbi:MAG: STAS domain-containing protein [bacterium]|jgi:anti-anti-sigma factor|nr:STAS domain-containing protein [bacterium]